jgi:hypothetical protein
MAADKLAQVIPGWLEELRHRVDREVVREIVADEERV